MAGISQLHKYQWSGKCTQGKRWWLRGRFQQHSPPTAPPANITAHSQQPPEQELGWTRHEGLFFIMSSQSSLSTLCVEKRRADLHREKALFIFNPSQQRGTKTLSVSWVGKNPPRKHSWGQTTAFQGTNSLAARSERTGSPHSLWDRSRACSFPNKQAYLFIYLSIYIYIYKIHTFIYNII